MVIKHTNQAEVQTCLMLHNMQASLTWLFSHRIICSLLCSCVLHSSNLLFKLVTSSCTAQGVHFQHKHYCNHMRWICRIVPMISDHMAAVACLIQIFQFRVFCRHCNMSAGLPISTCKVSRFSICASVQHLETLIVFLHMLSLAAGRCLIFAHAV